jgi:hypothetical protein
MDEQASWRTDASVTAVHKRCTPTSATTNTTAHNCAQHELFVNLCSPPLRWERRQSRSKSTITLTNHCLSFKGTSYPTAAKVARTSAPLGAYSKQRQQHIHKATQYVKPTAQSALPRLNLCSPPLRWVRLHSRGNNTITHHSVPQLQQHNLPY